MVIDSTLEFEKKRHVPVKYDRELVATTLKAMKRVQEIKAKRERAFYKKRMVGKKVKELEQEIKSIQQNIELVDAPTLKTQVMEHPLITPQKKDVEMA